MVASSAQKGTGRRMPFLIPVRLLRPHVPAIASLLGCKPRPKVALLDGIDIDAYAFPYTWKSARTEEVLAPIMSELGPLMTEIAMHAGREHRLFLPAEARVETVHKKLEANDDPLKYKNALIAYEPFLERVSRILRRRIVLHLDKNDIIPPFKEEAGVFHVVAGCRAQGESSREHVRDAYNLPLSHDRRHTLIHHPVRGRGVAFHDHGNKSDKDKAVIQVIGTTAYILIPILGYYHSASQEIFRHLIATLLNGLRDCERGKHRSDETDTLATIQTMLMEQRLAPSMGYWDECIAELHRDIEYHRQRLAACYAQLREKHGLKKTYGEHILGDAPKRAVADAKRLRRHPLVKRVYVRDRGMQLNTVPIMAKHEGHAYDLGPFTIRINAFGEASVWSQESTHPERVPHPHLPIDGTPCFGTGTEAITRAGAELRFGDAFTLILRWLQEGYDPHLAHRSIEEWPLADKKSVHGESS